MGNFSPFIYVPPNEIPWRTYFKDNRENEDSDARLLLVFGANYGAMSDAIQPEIGTKSLKGQEFITPSK